MSSTVCRHCGAPMVTGAIGCFRCGRLQSEEQSGTSSVSVSLPTELGALAQQALVDSRWRLVKLRGVSRGAAWWLAHDLSLDRPVWLKLLEPGLRHDARAVENFEAQARLLASCEHPNLIPVLGVGTHQGAPFLVTKALEGESLAEWLHRRGGLAEPGEAAVILSGLGAALTALHAQNSFHQGLRPAHVYVTADGEPVLLELGQSRDPGDGEKTDAVPLAEDLAWLAPEAISGGRPSANADLYALACLGWELITGAPPPRGDFAQLLIGEHTELPRLRSLAPDAPEVLERALGAALQFSPAPRGTLAELLAQVQPLAVDSRRATATAPREAITAPRDVEPDARPQPPEPLDAPPTAVGRRNPTAVPVRPLEDAPSRRPVEPTRVMPALNPVAPPLRLTRPVLLGLGAVALSIGILAGLLRNESDAGLGPQPPVPMPRPPELVMPIVHEVVPRDVAAPTLVDPGPLKGSVDERKSSFEDQQNLRPAPPRPALRSGPSVLAKSLKLRVVGSRRGSLELGTVKIKTTHHNKDASGAMVEVDQVVRGVTPIELNLSAGPHALRVQYQKLPVTSFNVVVLGAKVIVVDVDIATAQEAAAAVRWRPGQPSARGHR